MKLLSKKLLVLACSCLMGILIMEIVVRIKNHMDQPAVETVTIFDKDQDGILRHKPNLNISRYSGEAAKFRHFVTNSDGFVGKDFTIEKAADVKRIAVLGDSFVDAYQVDYEKTFTTLLNEKLNAEPPNSSTKYEVLNFGVANQGTIGEIADYEFYARKYNPDVVILTMFVGNDFAENSEYLTAREKFQVENWNSRQNIKNILAMKRETKEVGKTNAFREILEKSNLFQFLKQAIFNSDRAFDFFVRKTGLLANPYRQNADLSDPRNKATSNAFDFTVELVQKLSDTLKDSGSRLVLAIIPASWQIDTTNKNYEMRIRTLNPDADLLLPNKTMIERLGAKIPILDLSTSFKKAIDEERKSIYIKNEGHLNEFGHRFTADRLYEFLITNEGVLNL